jgi:hypothetical protein
MYLPFWLYQVQLQLYLLPIAQLLLGHKGRFTMLVLMHIAIFYNPNITGAPTTVTVTSRQVLVAGTIDCWADEFSGGVPQTIQDGGTSQLQTNPGTGTDAVTSGAFSTTQSGDLIYATTVQITRDGNSPDSRNRLYTMEQSNWCSFVAW